MIITKVICNNGYGYAVGESVLDPMSGNKEIASIVEHRAKGDGDKWYYDVIYTDDCFTRLFDVIKAEYREV